MRKSGKRLLVEGENDRLFFDACCQFSKLQGIQVGPPIRLGSMAFHQIFRQCNYINQ